MRDNDKGVLPVPPLPPSHSVGMLSRNEKSAKIRPSPANLWEGRTNVYKELFMLRAINPFLWKISRLRYIVTILTIFFISTIPVPLYAQSLSSIPDIKVVDEFLQNTVTSYRIPGLAVAIVSNNEVVFTSG